MKGDGLTTCRDCGKDYPVCACCPVHEVELEAADELAKAAKDRLQVWTKDTLEALYKALAAYEKARAK